MRIIGTVAILCLVGVISTLVGCADVDPFVKESEELTMTRADGNSPYYFYGRENEKIYLTLDTKFAFLSAKDPVLPEDISKYGVKSTGFKTESHSKDRVKATASSFYTELSFGEAVSEEQYLKMLSDIQGQREDVIVAPYFSDRYGNKIGLSNFFYVKLKNEEDVKLLEKTAEQTDCIVVSRDEYMPLWFTLSVTGISRLNALESANFFHESGLFSSAEPDLMADIALSNDTYFGQQYYLKNTGQTGGTYGVDIKAESAWQISTGNNVIVAVIDGGVDSMWEHQENPFRGDVINAYNDGPLEDGSIMGPFYELESSSPAAALRPGETITHTRTTIHLRGPVETLEALAARLLG